MHGAAAGQAKASPCERDTPARAGNSTRTLSCASGPSAATGVRPSTLPLLRQPQRRHWARWSATAALRLRRELGLRRGPPQALLVPGTRDAPPVARVPFPRRRWRVTPGASAMAPSAATVPCLRRCCAERSPPGRSCHSPAARTSIRQIGQSAGLLVEKVQTCHPRTRQKSGDIQHPASCRWAPSSELATNAGCRETKGEPDRNQLGGSASVRAHCLCHPRLNMGAAKAKTGWKPVCHRYDHRLVGCPSAPAPGTFACAQHPATWPALCSGSQRES